MQMPDPDVATLPQLASHRAMFDFWGDGYEVYALAGLRLRSGRIDPTYALMHWKDVVRRA